MRNFWNKLRLKKIQSYPHLAQVLSGWYCEKDQDRLNALHGIIFRGGETNCPWFVARYQLSGPELYEDFARRHIQATKSLEIPHFTGPSDGDTFSVSESDNGVWLHMFQPMKEDIASWVPDWRAQKRPLRLLPNSKDITSRQFCATISAPSYILNSSNIHVRARVVDEVVACSVPNYGPLRRSIRNPDNSILNQWYHLAKEQIKHTHLLTMFASTLLTEGRIELMERNRIAIDPAMILDHFNQWAIRNLDDMRKCSEADISEGIKESSDFGYMAEEICRNRTFFVTKNSTMGLGPLEVSPFTSVVLIHGLKTPFVVERQQEGDICYGDCYVHGLMDVKADYSDQDI